LLQQNHAWIRSCRGLGKLLRDFPHPPETLFAGE
jgi:hypothetical protein